MHPQNETKSRTEAPHEDCTVDVAILGAGPAGLAAVCACMDRGLSYVLLDRRGLAHSFFEYPHGLRFFSPPDEMELGGVPLPVAGGEKATREHYLAYLRAVVRARGITLGTWESVVAFSAVGNGYKLVTRTTPDAGPGRTVIARAVILATGVWSEPVRLHISGHDLPHVYSEFLEPTPYMGHDVLVIGSGNSAVGAALSLKEARARVTLSTRRPPKDYRCGLRPFVKRELDFAVDEKKLTLHANTLVTEIGPRHAVLQPVEYIGNEELTEGVNTDYRPTGEPFEVPCRFVFALLGHRPDVGFLNKVIGLETRPDGRPVLDMNTWETSLRNVFVCGSLADHSIDIVLKISGQAEQVVGKIAERLGG